jgi:uncharacterized protein (TIGR00255 family)
MSFSSMTGHGRGSAGCEGWRVSVEISSVNRRQLEVGVSLPAGLNRLEARISEAVRTHISRGRVSVTVGVHRTAGACAKRVQVDHDLAAAYVKALRQTARALDLPEEIRLEQILALPDVMRMTQPAEDVEAVGPLVDRAVTQALSAHGRMRRQEGKALKKDLETRLRLLRDTLARIRVEAPRVAERYASAMRERLSVLGVKWDAVDERLLKELALFADRSDITEELNSLDSHFQQAARLLRSKEPAGRTLDFLAQEMFREINTIGSKANDGRISEQVVLFKAELERIREQVQNVE